MELRRDPITQSWVMQQTAEDSWTEVGICPLCPGHEERCPPNLYVYPFAAANWQVRRVSTALRHSHTEFTDFYFVAAC